MPRKVDEENKGGSDGNGGQWIKGIDGNWVHIDSNDVISAKNFPNFATLLSNYPMPYSPGP